MSFSEQEQAIITAGLSNGKNKDEIKTALARYRLGFTPAPKPVEDVQVPSFGQRVLSNAAAGVDLAAQGAKQAFNASDAEGIGAQALQSVEGGLKMAQGAGRAITSPISAALEPVVEPIAPYIQPVAEAVKGASEAVVGERATENLGRAAELAGYVAPGLVTIPKTGVVGKIATMAGKADAPQMISGIQNTTLDAILKQPFRAAERIKTNVVDIKRVVDEYANFPETSKQLVTMGVPRDVTKSLGETNTVTLDLKKRMFDKAENGDTTALPSERPIMELAPVVSKQVTDVETTRQAIGRAIGQEVESIYKGQPVSTQPVKSALYDYVQDAGAKIADDGTIDLGGVTSFTGKKKTFVKEVFDYINALPSNISAQELMIIDDYLRGLKRDVLTDAREPLTYVSKIDGKKKDLINDIVEQVYKEVTVRAPNIRALRNEYRKMSDFKDEVERILRVSIDEGIDEVKMTGALRRVTSDAQSAGDVERILKELNQMSPTDVDIKSVLDFNNYLRKLYGAPETSMQGLLQESAGITPAGVKSSVVNAVMEKARGTLGATTETQKKALKDFFNKVNNKVATPETPPQATKAQKLPQEEVSRQVDASANSTENKPKVKAKNK